MLLLLFLLSVSSETCHSQYVYGGVVPYDPHYAARRPVRRSAIEALERLRLPVARYFPQVDTQVAPAPYPWTTGDLYALPPQWTDDFAPTVDEDEGGDYDNYEYENNYRSQPAYAEEIYRQEEEPEESDSGPMYNDMMASYLMGVPETRERPDMFENVQRRSQPEPIALPQASDNNKVAAPVTGAPAASTTQAPLPPPVQMTAVPSSPEKKNVKSLVVPDAAPAANSNSWREVGQKEEPLFRPLQNSQRTVWSERDNSPLHRAKNTQNKSPIPLLKQKQGPMARDPLLEELTNLKKKPGV
ncbi:uncharacterized protein TNIN_377481 [Trichonephila inaurata madagascariensis]|uniref:Uncharacterized protein n=1 Tax=Trichonephila inaurata madagascariensis TaxID=2747483 RepID=A0A8X6YD60_9ARAC|nr:uncharacterized protein TNIN_377481 [Trichonephila inaurata madagascariensis]